MQNAFYGQALWRFSPLASASPSAVGFSITGVANTVLRRRSSVRSVALVSPGFCFGIIIGGVIVDKIGYGKLVVLAFLFHVLSAFVTFAASTPDNAYGFLFWGMFLFAYANGTLEAVANPLVATLFPNNRTHYLNILHASWPAGMIIGAILGWILDDRMELGWKLQLALYLVPTVLYGLMFMGQSFPKSEASEKGLGLGEMMKDVGLLGAAVACGLLSLFFGDVLAPLFWHWSRHRRLDPWRSLADRRWRDDQFLGRLYFAVHSVHHSRARGERLSLVPTAGFRTSLVTFSLLSKGNGCLFGRRRSCSHFDSVHTLLKRI